jgi:hypothetical protein
VVLAPRGKGVRPPGAGSSLGLASPASTFGLEGLSDVLRIARRCAPPPDLVARTIVSAVQSARPLRRYVVGADALAPRISGADARR